MDIAELGWVRKSQECPDNDYWFDGVLLITQGVQGTLSKLEIYLIVTDMMYHAFKNNGADYLAVYINEEKDLKLFFIDQVTRKELADGTHPEEHHYATLMLAEEY